jgi:hypothetical protein
MSNDRVKELLRAIIDDPTVTTLEQARDLARIALHGCRVRMSTYRTCERGVRGCCVRHGASDSPSGGKVDE